MTNREKMMAKLHITDADFKPRDIKEEAIIELANMLAEQEEAILELAGIIGGNNNG